MGKLTGKAKAAFLAKMAAGRRRAARKRARPRTGSRTRNTRTTPKARPTKASRKSNPELLILTNPASPELARAVKRYRKFHGVDPKRALRRGRGKKAKVLVGLGDMIEIVYEPRRGQRKRVHWFHQFKRRAILATDADGNGLYIVDPSGKVMVDFSAGIVT